MQSRSSSTSDAAPRAVITGTVRHIRGLNGPSPVRRTDLSESLGECTTRRSLRQHPLLI